MLIALPTGSSCDQSCLYATIPCTSLRSSHNASCASGSVASQTSSLAHTNSISGYPSLIAATPAGSFSPLGTKNLCLPFLPLFNPYAGIVV